MRYAKPPWNGERATFQRKGDAQRAIDEALEGRDRLAIADPKTLAEYFADWLRLHPRSARTDRTNSDRISYVLDVAIDGLPLGSWLFDDLRRRHVHALVDHMLRDQGRAVRGARNILSALSAMTEDAITDEIAEINPFKGLRLRSNDPRARKPSRRIRIWSFEQMREFAAGGRPEVRARTTRPASKWGRCHPPHDYEALILTPGLTGLRLGELLALRHDDYQGEMLRVGATAHEGKLIGSSEQKNHDRVVPVPPSLSALIAELDADSSSCFLFPTPTGRMWRERNFYRDVWQPARLATGLDPTPHEFRHSYVSHLRAAGIDDADLAQITGHSVETMISVYTHPLGKSHDAVRRLVG
jgi:integrase